ncbi:hypothetical protein ONZ45_g376 [Pleurotus djamor]|nr:hypothetical protein ONZ45_g376 [Pleurotus djamor]
MSSPRSSQLWVPLECNPEVFNSWAKQAGLVLSQDCFHELLGLDEELLALIPQPVKALVLIFPDIGEVKARHNTEDELTRKEGTLPIDPTVVYVKQTIKNACGTMAIVHALANSNVTFSPHSPMSEFITQCQGYEGTSKESTGMRLVELDGRRIGAFDRGECKDFLRDAVRYIKESYIAFAAPGDVRFNILALAPPSKSSV